MVESIDNLFETIGDNLVESTAAQAKVNDLVGTGIIILAIVFADEIVQIHQEFRSGTGSAEHAANHEDHIDESATERLQICRCRGVATDGCSTTQQPRIHSDTGTIVGKRRLVILINKMMCQQVNISVSKLLAVH